jgi:hypothetical protein
MLAESLPKTPTVLSVDLHCLQNAFLPSVFDLEDQRSHNFGIVLEPRYIVGTGRLDQ